MHISAELVDDDSDSRTASVRGKRALPVASSILNCGAPNLSSSGHSNKKPENIHRTSHLQLSSPVHTAEVLSSGEQFQFSLLPHTNHSVNSLDEHSADQVDMDVTAQSQPSPTVLGKNRLASGFGAHFEKTRRQTRTDSRSYSGGSADEAIQISDGEEEIGDSEGGMVINLESQTPVTISDDDAQDLDMDTNSDSHSVTTQTLPVDKTNHELPQSSTTQSRLRLNDLNPEELEDQLKYALFQFDRSQVDLNRPVTCLRCLQEGHRAQECPEMQCSLCADDNPHPTKACPQNKKCERCRQRGHAITNCQSEMKITTSPLCDLCNSFTHAEYQCPQRFFPTAQMTGPVKLWISCCICASRSHLVGDCPDTDSTAARWSLKALDPGQITNMSLESGTRKLEKEVENRGARPPGLQIKGRAGLHHASARSTRPSSDDDSNDSFLRPPVRNRLDEPRPQLRLGKYEARPPGPSPLRPDQDRYDRYEAPSRNPRSRAPNDWYATDSFGQSRSRSPDLSPNYRPDNVRRRRTPSPRRFNGQAQQNPFDHRAQSPPGDHWRASHRADATNQSKRPSQAKPQNTQPQGNLPKPGNVVHLPSRKGSNPNLPFKPSAAAAQSSTSGATDGGGAKSRKGGRRPNRGRGEG